MSGKRFRPIAFLALVALLPACGVGTGGGTLTPTVAPAAPAGLVAQSGNGRVVIQWATSPAASTYTVRRSPAGGGPYLDVPGGGGLTTTSFVDSTVPNGTTQYYVVAAVNAFGESFNSPEIAATAGFRGAQIAAGRDHSLALLQDGTLWSWGRNNDSQLGNGSTTALSNVAVPVSTPAALRSSPPRASACISRKARSWRPCAG